MVKNQIQSHFCRNFCRLMNFLHYYLYWEAWKLELSIVDILSSMPTWALCVHLYHYSVVPKAHFSTSVVQVIYSQMLEYSRNPQNRNPNQTSQTDFGLWWDTTPTKFPWLATEFSSGSLKYRNAITISSIRSKKINALKRSSTS